MTPRRDSTAMRDSVARADSITRMETMRRDSASRADSLARMEQMRRDSVTRDSTARADSIARASAATTTTTTTTTDTVRSPVNPTMSSESYGVRRGGFYLGLAGGAAVPAGTISDFYKTGYNVTVPLGWQSPSSALGLRVDLGYSRFNGRTPGGSNPLSFQPSDPNIWSATANLTLDLLKYGESRRGALYLVGGGGVYRFTNFFSGNSTGTDVTDVVQSAFEGSPVTKGGLTGGAGLSFPIAGASLFVESLYTTVYTQGDNTRWVPVIVGLKWR